MYTVDTALQLVIMHLILASFLRFDMILVKIRNYYYLTLLQSAVLVYTVIIIIVRLSVTRMIRIKTAKYHFKKS